MEEQDLEFQVQIWQDLAISKQVMMDSAAKALGLPTECSTEELQEALDAVINKAGKADSMITQARAAAREKLEAMEKQVAASEKQVAVVTGEKDALQAELDASAQTLEAKTAGNADTVKKVKQQLVEAQKEIKATKKALGDSPENVLKKLKEAKKQKADEATARKKLDAEFRSLRSEKNQLVKEKAEVQEKFTRLLELASKLAEQQRTLHSLSTEQHQALSAAGNSELTAVPELDKAMLEAIEAAAEQEQQEK